MKLKVPPRSTDPLTGKPWEPGECPMKARTAETTWECWTYDVWGNAKDGYDVNDRSCFARAAELTLTVEVCNPGTPQEFDSASPTDRQIRRLFGLTCKFETDGDDMHISIARLRDGYPIGEMLCTSHKSLSPIMVRP